VIDAFNRAVLSRALERATDGPDRSLVIDLSGVEFCDLAGLRALISFAARKRVALAGLPAQAHTILGILRWDATPGVTVLPPDGHVPVSPLRRRRGA
jgi:STAS domain